MKFEEVREDVRVRRDSQEGENAYPRQSHLNRAPGTACSHGGACLDVNGIPIHRVDEQIRVDENHLLSLSLRTIPSSSRRSANSSVLSRSY